MSLVKTHRCVIPFIAFVFIFTLLRSTKLPADQFIFAYGERTSEFLRNKNLVMSNVCYAPSVTKKLKGTMSYYGCYYYYLLVFKIITT